jgi:multidrug efflux pump subunit AcrA (membrane-fusion protein)
MWKSAQCEVILQEVKDTLVIPQIAVFDLDSSKIVYVKAANGVEMRKVRTAESSPREIVISSGLQQGEVISLSQPADKKKNNVIK